MKRIIRLTIAMICLCGPCAFAQSKAEVLILPTIHGGHAKNVNYTFDHVRNIIKNFRPDIIAVEIRPEDLEKDTVYLKKFYQPEMIMAMIEFPGVRKAGIDYLGADLTGKDLPDNFNRDTVGDMGRFRLANQKMMRDTAFTRLRTASGMVALKAKQGSMMGRLSANEMLDGSYNEVTDEYTRTQSRVLKGTPYEYYDIFSIQRDQIIADNIKKLARENPGKRIIILTGANHHNRALATLKTAGDVTIITKVADN